MEVIMKLIMKEEDYKNIINHCIRKLNKIYHDDETNEQQAFGVILGEKGDNECIVKRVVK